MRLSIDDPDFPSERHNNAKIYLNGKRVEDCTFADEEQGVIERLTFIKGATSVETVRETGKVKIDLAEIIEEVSK